MSDPTWLTVLSILVGVIVALIAWFGRLTWQKLTEHGEQCEQIRGFLSGYAEREKAWWDWRQRLDADRRERREEYHRRLDAHAKALRVLEQRMARYLGHLNGHTRRARRDVDGDEEGSE